MQGKQEQMALGKAEKEHQTVEQSEHVGKGHLLDSGHVQLCSWGGQGTLL